MSSPVGSSSKSAPHTALIEVRGEIAADTEASAENLLSGAEAAFEDHGGAQAVVLRINSPGGSPVQAGIVNDEIHPPKALHNKPVYAVVEGDAPGRLPSRWRPTRSTSTRPARSAASAC